MAESHLQLNPDASIEERKTILWPDSKGLQKEIIRGIFEHNNWSVIRVDNISGSHWKVETECQTFSWKINLYISSIRDEKRASDEFKMQLSASPIVDEDGWINLLIGIYQIDNGQKTKEYILSAYDIKRYNLSTNPSMRGTRTSGLQKAMINGMNKTEMSIIFRPDFIYYYIDEIANSSNKFQKENKTFAVDNQYNKLISAIRTKPFILLAGISGTGKSRIVRELARACWAIDDDNNTKQKPDNFDMIPVKPNWHDSSELLGYKSNVPIPHYVSGDFLKFVVKAWTMKKEYNELGRDIPCFLCLDEMNLAPVEQYFAEYLSCIESRNNTSGNICTDAILKKEKEEWYHTLISQFSLHEDLHKKFLTEGISIPSNLIVMGTVNMDETTFAFSRKVLDRAMTLEMNDVNLRGGIGESSDEIPDLSDPKKITILGTRIKAEDIYHDQINSEMESLDQVLGWLENINGELEETPFKIAYRTRNEIVLYVINSEELGKERLIAFDEAINMKILPRIEGDANKVGSSIDNLINVIEDLYNSDTQNEETESAVATDEDTPSVVKRNKKEHSPSLKKLNEMKKRMMKQYYCTYWS